MPALIDGSALRSWYAMDSTSDGAAEIKIYEDIGFFGVTAKQFTDDLEKVTAKTINLRLNTYGGEVFDGIAIYNALRAHPAEVTVHVDGIAASAGSIIAMAGDEIRMADNAFLMIHNARGGVIGGAEDMRREAELLDKINDNIALTYQGRAGKTRKYWRDKMAAETWFTAAEAKTEGLADAIDEPAQPENKFDFKIYNNVPESARTLWGKTNPITAPDASPRGDSPAPVLTQEVIAMSDTASVITPPAQNLAAGAVAVVQGNDAERFTQQAIQNYIENGKILGREEGRAEELSRMQKLLEAAPGRPQLVIDAFVNRQDPGALSLAFNAANQASAAEAEIAQKLRTENARLQSLISAGGHTGVPTSVSANTDSAPQSYDLEPEVRAKMEWDSKPAVRAQFHNNEKTFMAYRVNQIKGNIRVLSKSVA